MMLRLRNPVVRPDPAPAPAPAPAVAPAPAQGQGNAPPTRLLMRRPSKRAWIYLRLAQALLAAAALAAMVVASAYDIFSVIGFRISVSVAALQCLWSLTHAILNFYAFLGGRFLENPRVVGIRGVGDEITGILTFGVSAACGSAAVTIYINSDMEACYEKNCPSFISATAIAYLFWFCLVMLNAVVKNLQGP